MKRLSLLLAVVAVVALAPVAFAEEAKAPPARPIFGELTKIDGKVLTINVRRRDADPVAQAVTLDDKAEIFADGPAKLESLKVGDRVRITQGDKRTGGEITKIDGKVLTLSVRRRNADPVEQTVTVDDSTTITAAVKGKLEDLKVGQRVSVTLKEGKATRVDIRPARPRPAAQ